VIDQRTKVMDEKIRDFKNKTTNEITFLLIGAGESGKSTIAKQMKIIHLDGFTPEDCQQYKHIIYGNIFSCFRVLIKGCKSMQNEVAPELQDTANYLQSLTEEQFEAESTKLLEDCKQLWKDPAIQEVFKFDSGFQILDSCKYYLDDLDRILVPSYNPNDQDILRSRAQTNGVYEIKFSIQSLDFKLIDVGGQRSERRKWLGCFDIVKAVLFCVSLSEYNLTLYEDEKVNRMHESLRLFEEFCTTPYFLPTPVIIFFNKEDIFREKIEDKKVPLSVCFDDYKGEQTFRETLNFIINKFLELNREREKKIYKHTTIATNTENIQWVFDDIQNAIMDKIIENMGYN